MCDLHCAIFDFFTKNTEGGIELLITRIYELCDYFINSKQSYEIKVYKLSKKNESY
jgi:hypothetical protein